MNNKLNIDKYYKLVELPITINSDNAYLVKLDEVLNNYILWIEILFSEKGQYLWKTNKNKIIKQIKTDIGVIKDSVNLYYKGNVSFASDRIRYLLTRIIEEDKNNFIVSEVDKSYCTRLGAYYPKLGRTNDKNVNLKNDEITLFRARNKYYTSPKEMYHIPLDKRDIIGTERFSIPGVPCLYLGASVFDIWLEMGRPAYSNFNVSSIKFTDEGKKLKILNLAITRDVITGLNTKTDNESEEEKRLLLISMLRLYPLIIATSIRNNNSNGKFKSDYIVSHLIMMNLQKLKIDGVAYISKRLEKEGDHYAYPQMINYAFPAFEKIDDEDKYGTICKKILVTQPQNYEEFFSIEKIIKNEKNSFFSKVFSEDDDWNRKIKINGKKIDYFDTKFHLFEESICGLKYYNYEDALIIH